MRQGILVTNDDSHTPDKWAALVADQIGDLIQIDLQSTTDAAVAARMAKPRFVVDLSEKLFQIFAKVRDREWDDLGKEGTAKLATACNPLEAEVAEAIAAVQAAAAGTPFAAHFSQPQVEASLRTLFDVRLASVMDIERSWFADENPDAMSKQYRAARAAHGPRRCHEFLGGDAEGKKPSARKPN